MMQRTSAGAAKDIAAWGMRSARARAGARRDLFGLGRILGVRAVVALFGLAAAAGVATGCHDPECEAARLELAAPRIPRGG